MPLAYTYSVLTGATCSLCHSPSPTCHHIVFSDCIGHKEGILTLQTCLDNIAGVQSKYAFDLAAIIPPNSLVCSHLADIVVYIAELKAQRN